jgi:hypothetical protein
MADEDAAETVGAAYMTVPPPLVMPDAAVPPPVAAETVATLPPVSDDDTEAAVAAMLVVLLPPPPEQMVAIPQPFSSESVRSPPIKCLCSNFSCAIAGVLGSFDVCFASA